MNQHKKKELLLLLLWNIPAFGLSFLIGSNYIITAVLFFVIPAIYLSIKRPSIIKKIFSSAVVILVPSVSILNYFAHTDGSYYNFSIIGIRIFGVYPIDDFLWGFLYFYYILMVYEYFFEKERILKTPKRTIVFEIIGFSCALLFSFAVYVSGHIFTISYFYAWLVGIVFLFLPILILYNHPRIFKKTILVGLFFIPLSFLYEYVAISKVNWIFPGHHFLGYVTLFNISFPLEEMLWLLLAAPSVIVYYEFFADDEV